MTPRGKAKKVVRKKKTTKRKVTKKKVTRKAKPKKEKDTQFPIWVRQLAQIGACREALAWGCQYATFDEAWNKCTRPDWMIWLIRDPHTSRVAWQVPAEGCEIWWIVTVLSDRVEDELRRRKMVLEKKWSRWDSWPPWNKGEGAEIRANAIRYLHYCLKPQSEWCIRPLPSSEMAAALIGDVRADGAGS